MVRTEKRVVKIKPLGIQEDVTIISTSKDMVNTARELLKNLEAAEEKETNFSRITESPEILAEWIAQFARDLAHDYLMPERSITNVIGNAATRKNDVLEWLMKEVKK